MELQALRDNHLGETAWVFGSGPSLEFLSPDFFADKLCITTNFVGKVFGLGQHYRFTHYHSDAKDLIADRPDLPVVVNKLYGYQKTEWQGPVHENIVFNTPHSWEPPGENFDPFNEPVGDSLVFGSSGIHGAIHLAAYMGAKNIVMVGADCGHIDGKDRLPSYPDGDHPWALYNKHLQMMKAFVQTRYGCNMYSLNPFVNLNLEGHTFTGVN